MINDIPTASEARRPRAVLMVGDKQIKWTAFEMQHNGIYEAATLRVTMPVEFKDWAFWSQQTEIIVDVYVGFLSGPDENLTTDDLPLLMTARIDEFRLDPVTSTVTLAGRDLTSLFIDHKVSANYQNLTSSQIMSVLVEKFPILNQPDEFRAFLNRDGFPVVVGCCVIRSTMHTVVAAHGHGDFVRDGQIVSKHDALDVDHRGGALV